MHETVLDAADRIRRLEVQGARNVAIAAIKAVKAGAKQSTARSKGTFLKELIEAKTVLFASRETEPLMRNAIRHVVHMVETSEEESVKELVDVVSRVSSQFLESLERSKEKIADVGSKRVSNGSKVLTHCHSSTVTNILRRAKQEGKSF